LALLGIARCRYVIAVAFKRGVCLLVFVDGVSTVPRSVVLAPSGIARCRYVIVAALILHFVGDSIILVDVDGVSAVRPNVVLARWQFVADRIILWWITINTFHSFSLFECDEPTVHLRLSHITMSIYWYS
jgi:hypothetical protein